MLLMLLFMFYVYIWYIFDLIILNWMNNVYYCIPINVCYYQTSYFMFKPAIIYTIRS